MQLARELENFNPFRREPGKLPLSYLARNLVIDRLLYDVASLSSTEHSQLLSRALDYDEGGMLVVWPASDNQPIEYWALSHDLITAHGDIDCVAVPGMGSSPLGTAALARQVANATGRKVVGVIPGCSTADVVAESMGGWFDFGLRNRVRAWFDAFHMRLPFERAAIPADEAKSRYKVLSDHFLVEEPEANTLLNLMLRQGDMLRLMVGHGRGALTIQNAAWGFVAEPLADEFTLDHLHVYTFGCGAALPARIRSVHQFVGTLDAVGWLNTPGGVTGRTGFNWVGGRGHALSSTNPASMPLERLLPRLTHGVRGPAKSIGAGGDVGTGLTDNDATSGATVHQLRLPTRH